MIRGEPNMIWGMIVFIFIFSAILILVGIVGRDKKE